LQRLRPSARPRVGQPRFSREPTSAGRPWINHQKKEYRHNWLKCIDLYKKVYKVYPKSNQAVWALYHSANLYTGLYRYSGSSKDLNKALALYRSLAGKHKGHSLADDAQYKIGEIFYKFKNDPALAYVEFLKVDVNFPKGDMRPKAKQMLNKLAVTLRKKNEKKGLGSSPLSLNPNECLSKISATGQPQLHAGSD